MSLESALQSFSTQPLLAAARSLFKDTLKIPLSPLADSPITPQRFFRDAYKPERHDSMENLFLVGRITDDSFHAATQATADLDTAVAQAAAEDYNGMFLIAADLGSRELTRSDLAARTREINRTFSAPVIVVFKHTTAKHPVLSIGVASRRPHKRDHGKDVLGKVSMIREIHLETPHRGHLEILKDFSLAELEKNGGKGKRGQRIDSFKSFHAALEQIFNTDLLNKNFYAELSNWYFWAKSHCHFPLYDPKADKYDLFHDTDKAKEHEAKNLIRLLTRTLFVWFIKERGLVPTSLFNPTDLQDRVLKSFDPESKDTNYYKVVLQNLFFATLNQTHGQREFRKEGQHQNTTTLLRYQDYLKSPSSFVQTLEDSTPFLNGGLFECLDRPHSTKKGPQGGKVIIYEDGFSDRKDNPLRLPDYLFFGKKREVDLSGEDAFGLSSKRNVEVRGLIHILESYKFTIVENTPIDQEIALDPELLGQVFENLLASYNPETKKTARKQTGSFYTPRPIVDYMVDEVLKAHLKRMLIEEAMMKPEDAEARLEMLFAYNDRESPFDKEETEVLIRAIDNCKILDPACGSGAFPMGALQKLVYVLGKLDPGDELWKQRQLTKVDKIIEAAQEIDDASFRERAIADAQAQKKDIEEAFAKNELGYGRKLYLIENCLYGVDIQSIATQVTKLRFFISLVVDQSIDRHRDNFGVRPLPNLETKFVTADSLIRVERPESQGEFFEIAEVSALQRELKQVRHSLFSAKTPRTKDKYREQDKELREAIAAELKENGWDSGDAAKLAAWDPYDQNASAPYFDPEWMFGVKAFDIVIGNPPFVSFYSRESSLTKDNEALLDCYRKQCEFTKYESGKGRLNLWMFFAELSVNLCTSSGHLALIADVNFTKDLATSIRRYLAENSQFIEFIYDLSEFENVASGQIVFIAGKKAASRRDSFIAKKSLEDQGCIVPYSAVCAPEYSFVPSRSGGIELRLSSFQTLGSCPYISIVTGVQIGGTEIYKGIPVKDHFYRDSWDSKIIYPSIRVKSVTRYSSPTFERGIKFDYDLASEITKTTKKSAIVLQKYSSFLKQDKIVIRQSAPLIIATLAQANCCGEYSLFSCITDPRKISLTYLLSILNSKLISYFAVKNEIILQKNGTQPQIRKSGLEKIPIVIASSDDQTCIGHLVEKRLLADATGQSKDAAALEAEIDQRVYALYGLTPEEIAIVEGGGK